MRIIDKLEGIIFVSLTFFFFSYLLIFFDNMLVGGLPFASRYTSPTLFPRAILIMTFISIGVLLARDLYLFFRNLKQEKETQIKSQETTTIFIMAVGWVFLFVFSMQYIGFFISALLFLMGMQFILKNANFVSVVVFPLVTIASIYFFFIVVMTRMLPRGTGIFQQLNRFFY